MATIAKLNGITWSSISKRNGVAVASISKIIGMTKPTGGWTPGSVSGLIHLCQIQDLALSDGDLISAWTDSSGNGNNGSASGTARPTYKTGITASGKAVARFEGSNNVITFSNFISSLTAGTLFLVIKIDNDPPAGASTSGCWNLGTAPQSSHFPYSDGNIYEAFGTTARKTVGNPTPSLSSAFRTYIVTSKASEYKVYLDGSSIYSTATNTVGFPSSSITLGANLSSHKLDGDIAVFGLYNSALSSSDVASLHSYLNSNYV